MTARPFSVALGLVAALALTHVERPALAAPPAGAALEPWEQEVERESAAQTALIEQAKVTKTIASIVSKYENRVFRDPSALNEFLFGRALYYAGNPTAAKAAMERCLVANPAFHPAHTRLAILLVDLKNLPDAEAHLRQVLAVRPGQHDALKLLSTIAFERKDWSAAAGWLDQLLSQDPSDALARRNLVFVRLQQKDFAAAKQQAQILAGREPENVEYRYLLAVAQLGLKEDDPAIALLESIAREAPGNVEVLEKLSAAYARKQNWPRVRATLERMLPHLDEESRKKVLVEIEKLKNGAPAPGATAGTGALTWDDVLRAVEDPSATRREDALVAIYEACMTGEVKQIPSRVLRRITPDVEPSDAARALVVKIIGTLEPERLLPLLSIALDDPSERVRMLAADTIGRMNRAIGFAYLYPMLSIESLSVAEYQSIRAALSAITGFADLPDGAREVTNAADVAASREAWRRWRLSDASDAVKLAAIRQLVEYRELSAERLLYDFVLDPGFEVMSEAYRRMRDAVRRAPRDSAESKAFPLFPSVPDAEVTRPAMRSLQDRVAQWWTTYIAERRALRQAKQPSTPVPPK